MIFYDCATAPSPRRARIFIAEKNLDVETRQVDLRNGEQLGEEFLALNPRGTVPVLVTDEGVVLTENSAIALYLEERFPEPALMGSGPAEKAAVLQWNQIAEQSGLAAIAEVLRNSAPGMAGRAITGPANFEQIPALAERGRVRVGLFYDMLESQLGEKAYVMGDSFTLADITAFVFVEFASRVKMPPPENCARVASWHTRIAERPSTSL